MAPAEDNLGFIKRCEAGLPAGASARYLRADAASYQGAVFEHCEAHEIGYVVRARRSPAGFCFLYRPPAHGGRPPLPV